MKGFKSWVERNAVAITSAAAMVAGLTAGTLLNNEYSAAVGSVEKGAYLIKVMVIPVLVVFAVVSNFETVTKSGLPARLFSALAGGYQVGLAILSWHILLHWYRHPEDAHMEPLFVATGVALAVLEWCRSKLRNLK